ncbi:putative membrane protein [Aquitalea magnusonii]|uniref:Putative membrane protein n=1 Tax=Aquitalea magnusonii TaxID=332411 RepID=A0A3G9GGZ2_9NEIS|nr:DUF485 domain-containing protein [Aquitalea magnusonii]BBF86745.1 putative membrane protein [Aquitalea magnusonii]
MNDAKLELILQHPDFQQLIAQKTRLSWSLSAVMLVIYYGFIMLLAFSPGTLGSPLSDGAITIGIPVGVAIILLTFVLTGIYVWIANRYLDPLNEKVLREFLP